MDKKLAECKDLLPKISKVHEDFKIRHDITESTRNSQLILNLISVAVALVLCYKELASKETEMVFLCFAVGVMSSYNFVRVFDTKRKLIRDFQKLDEIFTMSLEKSRKRFFDKNIDSIDHLFFYPIKEFLIQENKIRNEYNFCELIMYKQFNYICDGIILFSSTICLALYKSNLRLDNILVEQFLLIITLLGLIFQYIFLIERTRYFELRRNTKLIKIFTNICYTKSDESSQEERENKTKNFRMENEKKDTSEEASKDRTGRKKEGESRQTEDETETCNKPKLQAGGTINATEGTGSSVRVAGHQLLGEDRNQPESPGVVEVYNHTRKRKRQKKRGAKK